MTKKIRLVDLAKQAGVSTATVSRVLNDKGSVAVETRHAVLAALDLLGYERPERLRERGGGLIGLILPELTNPIFPSFAQHLQTMMSMQNYTPLFGTQVAGATTEDAYVEAMLRHRVSGLIFVSGLHADLTADLERYERITARGIPFVTINGANPQLDAPDFSADDYSAVTQAMRYLIAQGHSRIGLATGPLRFVPAKVKADAYHDALQKFLPNIPPMHAVTLFTVEGGQSAAQDLIKRGCTAIICGSDVMALGAIRFCHHAGIRVPQDVSIIGYDDSPLIAFSDPPLTTLRQPVKAISEAAINALITNIQGTNTINNSMRFASELIVRSSAGPVNKNNRS